MIGAIRHFGVQLVVLTVLLLPTTVRAEDASTDCGDTSGYQAGAPWPAYHGCSTRLGLTDVHGPTSPTLNWRTNLGWSVNAPVIAADGTLYVGAGAQLIALSSTGVQRWSTWAFGNIASAPAIGADGTVYVVSAAGALVAVNPTNGSVKWVYLGAWGHVTADRRHGHDSFRGRGQLRARRQPERRRQMGHAVSGSGVLVPHDVAG